MKKCTGILSLLLLAVCFALPCASQAADGNYIPKVASFDIFVDDSGSMMMKHEALGTEKILIARNALQKMNIAIPALNYNASVHSFAPYADVLCPAGYDRATMSAALASFNADADVFNRKTPMGDGIAQLHPFVNDMAKKAAIILVSDGKSNMGSDPVAQVEAMYADNAELCVHVLSVADDAKGQDTLNAIAALRPCSVMANAGDLLADDAMLNKYVADIFYTEAAPALAEEQVIVLRSVQFAFDSAALTKDAESVLDEAALLINEQPNKHVVVEGHTDNSGPEAYNAGLSLRRAQSVKAFLVKSGVDAKRLATKGFGESHPSFDNTTVDGRALNRRVELVFE